MAEEDVVAKIERARRFVFEVDRAEDERLFSAAIELALRD
jgi:hypothetical protein